MKKPYQVLARKYRPQRFEDVLGQEAVVATLKNALKFERAAYAYLFSGSRGVGKTTLARLFAKALNCGNLSEVQEPCNSCPSCLEVQGGQSLDVIEIDGASNRGIDDIRQINETVGYAPSRGKFKIYIIDEVHMLTKEAFNALLKTLEEPPPRAKFFFATTEPQKVLPTILSRCQRFDLARISPETIRAKLGEIARDLEREVDPAALPLIASFADGSLRDAESLFDQLLCFTEGRLTPPLVREVLGLLPEEHFFALDRAFFEARFAYAFELVDLLFRAGKDLGHVYEQLLDHYRSLTLCKTGGGTEELKQRYGASLRLYTTPQCLTILQLLLQGEANFHKSASQRIALESLLLQILRIKNQIPVEVLVRRLAELEEHLQLGKGEMPLEPVAEPMPVEEEAPAAPPVKEVVAEVVKEEVPVEPQLVATPFRPLEVAAAAPVAAPVIAPVTTPVAIPVTASVAPPPPAPVKPPALEEKRVEEKRGPQKHPSHYDTLLRFAAVELEGSARLQS